MSYAQFSETSDVYVFAHVDGFIQCCGCHLCSRWDYQSAADVVAHMREHVAAGDLVPEHLLNPETYRVVPWGSPFQPYVYPHQPAAAVASPEPSADGS